jgi:cell division protein FtsI/penicillin-binding protein 2
VIETRKILIISINIYIFRKKAKSNLFTCAYKYTIMLPDYMEVKNMAFKIRNKIPSIHFGGLDEEKKRHKNTKDVVVTKRIIALLVFLLFTSVVLTGRLAYIQLRQQSLFALKLDRYSTNNYTRDANRGEIYDRNGHKLVANVNINNAVYYAPESITSDEIESTADFLVANITIDTSDITARQKRDYFRTGYKNEAESLVSADEKAELSDDEYENLILERLTDEFMDTYMSEEQLQKTRLVFLMNQTTSGSAILIEDLSVEEASIIGANASSLKGVRVLNDFTREHIYGNDFARVLGRVTTKQQGLPADQREQLLALNYPNDARVGISGLELQYESLLRGTDSTYTLTYDEFGNPIPEYSMGRNGSNLRISIDWELQSYANEVITNELIAANNINANRYFDRMFLILMDPNNGDVIVMAGKQINKETGQVSDYAAGNYQAPYLVGSTTKGGTIYTAYKEGVITPGQVMMDEPILIRGTPEKKSWKNWGLIDDIEALAFSSNVYMFRIAMAMGGSNYVPNESLYMDPTTIDTYRQSIGELGLGVKTGLDVTDEASAGRGVNPIPGHVLDNFIGQYDTYTNIQLAQYTSTLANGGKRVQPRLLLDAFTSDEEGNPIITYENDVTILGDVSEHAMAFERISAGYRACVTLPRGTCRSPWGGKSYVAHVKTGTAEFIDYSTNIDHPNRLTTGWINDSEGNAQIVFSSIAYRQNTAVSGGDGSASTIAALVVDRYYEKYGIR